MKGIGAVNTLVFDGRDVLGYNTDYRAAMDCLTQCLNVDKSREQPLQGMTVMVLGAGGVSRDRVGATATPRRSPDLLAEL